MVTIYILKLIRGKYYVGLTKNSFQRIDQHRNGYGAAWTKKYEPVSIVSVQSGLNKSDENRITVETMKKYGIRNVRGGDWCKINMTKYEIANLEKIVYSSNKIPAAKKNMKKMQGYCIRCGDKQKFDIERPLCCECYRIWRQYSNPDYIEDNCHKCGQDWDTSIDRPLCPNCWRKTRGWRC